MEISCASVEFFFNLLNWTLT